MQSQILVECKLTIISLNFVLIPLTSDHKHLGITFSEVAKWNKHVENIIKSVSKYICVLRKLKYKLNRQNLEKLK
jgi:hypothetical protein